MSHPLEAIKPAVQKKYFTFLFILTILIMVIMNVLGTPLITPSAPSGIVSFELAFSPTRAQQIISSWSPDSQLRAAIIHVAGTDYACVCAGIGKVAQSGQGNPAGWSIIYKSKNFAAGRREPQGIADYHGHAIRSGFYYLRR